VPLSSERLKVGLHHFFDAVNFCKPSQFLYSTAMFLSIIAYCLEGDIKADLVAVFEAVGHGFPRFENFDGNAFNAVFLGTFGQRVSRHAHEAKRLALVCGCPAFAVESEPDLRGSLCGQFGKLES
jgi:hypothetical protein